MNKHKPAFFKVHGCIPNPITIGCCFRLKIASLSKVDSLATPIIENKEL